MSARVMCGDGFVIEEWQWCDGLIITPVSSKLLLPQIGARTAKALGLAIDSADRCVAAAETPRSTAERLYGRSQSILVMVRSIGARILETDTYDYARGLSVTRLTRIYLEGGAWKDRQKLIGLLIKASSSL